MTFALRIPVDARTAPGLRSIKTAVEDLVRNLSKYPVSGRVEYRLLPTGK
jgi:hypothetical protein